MTPYVQALFVSRPAVERLCYNIGMFAHRVLGHAGEHTTESVAHFLSGWHLLLIMLGLVITAAIIYTAKSNKSSEKEEDQ